MSKRVALLKLVVSAALLAWVVSRARLDEVLDAFAGVDPIWLVPAVLSPGVGIVVLALRWRGLLRTLEVDLPLPRLVQSCVVAGFVKQFLPTTIGGDAVRGYDSWKAGASKSGAVAAVVLDRVMGLLVLVLFAIVATFAGNELTRHQPLLEAALYSAILPLVVTIWCIFSPPAGLLRRARSAIDILPGVLARPLSSIFDAVTAYRGKHRALATALALSVVLQVNVVTFYWLIGRAMGFPVAYPSYFLVVPLALFAMLVPVSINGIGVREGVFVLLLATFGVSGSEALAFAWLEYGIFLVWGLVGGLVLAFR